MDVAAHWSSHLSPSFDAGIGGRIDVYRRLGVRGSSAAATDGKGRSGLEGKRGHWKVLGLVGTLPLLELPSTEDTRDRAGLAGRPDDPSTGAGEIGHLGDVAPTAGWRDGGRRGHYWVLNTSDSPYNLVIREISQ